MKIYNTLTRSKEEFVPNEAGKVKMYVCGPTVYNFIHIGNARPVIVFDTVRNYLEYKGYEVNYVSNITDVDDKLIKAAQELQTDVLSVANRFIEEYFSDISSLGCRKANHHPRVMDHINDIINFIELLIKKDMAYESDGDVYYRTSKFEKYGQLSGQSIDDLKFGARIDVDEKKDSPLDFTLWKKNKPNEISWDSPWGKGRPGWHIECSALSHIYLGDTIDIHAGGQDLAFPHHENEIAQSEAVTGKPFAKYWMHNGFLNIDSEKMSKSLGNFIRVRDLITKFDPNIFRFFILSVHYRHPLNYSEVLLEQAQIGFERILTTVANLEHRKNLSCNLTDDDAIVVQSIESLHKQFEIAMDDDFNTANAISTVFELVKLANNYLMQKNTAKFVIEAFLQEFKILGDILGLKFRREMISDAFIMELVTARKKARLEGNFKLADEIRKKLDEMSIVLEDTAQGTRWKTKN